MRGNYSPISDTQFMEVPCFKDTIFALALNSGTGVPKQTVQTLIRLLLRRV